jgi:SAM-dependent methyltransferase
VLRRVWRIVYRRVVVQRLTNHSRLLQLLSAGSVTSGSRVLDVGCGQGVVLSRMRDELDLVAEGVDINPDTVALVRSMGFVCREPDDSALDAMEWDAIVMSHVIEHLSYEPLVQLLERFLTRLVVGGVLVVASPLMHPRFYDDIDHVRPYPPEALDQLLGRRGQEVQEQLAVQYELVEVWFRRSALEFSPGAATLLGRGRWRHAANLALLFTFYVTFGLVGRRTGWAGLYRRTA